MLKYIMTDKITKENILKFFNDYKNELLKPSLKS